jgi:glycosyltransferase involved in cell wall biosynthesis
MSLLQENKRDAVSVIVATYNSAAFVVETLESIKNQTFPILELIVTDDASTDDTCEVVLEWINRDDARARFTRIELLRVNENTGVSANCNRGFKAAQSKWVKLIAGDDILLSNCVEDNMNFVQKNLQANVLFSRVRIYLDTFELKNYLKSTPGQPPAYCTDPNISADDQYKILLLGDRIHYSPSCFLSKAAVLSVGGYDESNRLFEDYPMWLKLTKAGNRLYFMDKETVGYRKHNKATVNRNEATLFKPIIFEVNRFRQKNVYPYLPWDITWLEKFTIGVCWILHLSKLNRDTPFLRTLYRILTVYLNPFQYIISFKKHVLRLGETNMFYR